MRFERMVFEGRALAGGDPAAASLVLGEALGLWRGRAFEDFTYEAFAHDEIADSRSCGSRPSSSASMPTSSGVSLAN